MLKKRKIIKRNINNYKKIVSAEEIKRIKKLAKLLKGKKIIHINATPDGGGVAEILESQPSLERSLGIDSNWYFIKEDRFFFSITKKIHNGLQGLKISLTEKEKKYYLNVNKKIAEQLNRLKPDLVIIHDPQPLAISAFYDGAPMILRIHLDLSTPNQQILKFLNPYIKFYQKVIFSLPEYVIKNFDASKAVISYPTIDPLTKKNKIIKPKKLKNILKRLNINPSKPIIAQVSRFGIWKNPVGAAKAFYIAKKEIPDLQLVLLGVMEAQDDPSAPKIYQKVKKYAKGDTDVILISDLKKIGLKNEVLVNALQNCANPILQLSLREGFGLTVTEGMWHSKVVIGGNVGGIKFQIKDEKNGFLVDNTDEAAKRIVEILKNPKLAKKIGEKAHLSVKKNFLITKLIKDHLKIYNQIIK
ncbi:MAG: glycosyltransferase [Patescibacteria group bacterium]|nr:glycosyltransferase [Patescibacteria group bacterium]